MAAHADLGNRWVEIAKRIEGRTDSGCKNHFHKSAVQQRWRGILPNQRWRAIASPSGSLVLPDGPVPLRPATPLIVFRAAAVALLPPAAAVVAAVAPPACHATVEQSPLSQHEQPVMDRDDDEVASAVGNGCALLDGKPMDVAAYALLAMMASTPE